MCLVPTKATDSPDGADRADRLQLALCLPSGADNPDRRRIRSREVLRRDSGGSSGAPLSKSVGLNHGDKLSGRHVEQVDPKANSRARRRVILEPGIAARRPRREHHVDCGLSCSDSLPRAVCCLAPPYSPESFLDRPQGILHLEEARSEEHTSELQSRLHLV